MRISWQDALEAAARCGFSRAALVPARTLSEYVPGPLGLRSRIGGDPFALLPQAQSVLVAGMPFAWHTPWPDGHGQVNAYYFHSQRAHESICRLREALVAIGALAADGQRLPAKLLGWDAGFGLLGKNSLLRSDAWGSCFTLRVLVTDIPPPGKPAEALSAKPCGSCRRCVDACPTGALDGAGAVDPDRCIRAFMLRGEIVPDPLRPYMGQRLLGCEVCQRACPHNRHIPCVPPEEVDAFAIGGLLEGSRQALERVAGRIGWNEARLERVQAQAALAAGNSGDPRYVPLLETLYGHARPAIAAHARWAAGQITKED